MHEKYKCSLDLISKNTNIAEPDSLFLALALYKN